MTQPTLGIVMPCLNVAPYVEESLDSIANQTFRAWRLNVVVDTKSTDNSEEVIRTWIRRRHRSLGGRVICTSVTSAGVPKALNTGVRYFLAEGDPPTLFCPAAGDDLMHKHYLDLLVSHFAANPRVPCTYGVVKEFGDRTGLWVHGSWAPGRLAHKHVISGNCLWPMEVFKELGGYDEAYTAGCEDWDLAARAEATGIFNPWRKPVFDHRAIYYHRAHGDSLTGRMNLEYHQWCERRIAALFPDGSALAPRTTGILSAGEHASIVRGPILLD